jgi:hypothetical protein
MSSQPSARPGSHGLPGTGWSDGRPHMTAAADAPMNQKMQGGPVDPPVWK